MALCATADWFYHKTIWQSKTKRKGILKIKYDTAEEWHNWLILAVPVPRDTKTIGMTTVHAVINKPMEQPVESMLGTSKSVSIYHYSLSAFFLSLVL